MPVYKLVWRLGPVLAETLKVLSIIGILCSGQIFHVQQQIKQTWKQTKVWLSFKLNLRLGTTRHFGQFCDAPTPPHPSHHPLCSPCPCGSSDCFLWQTPFHRCCSGTVGSSTAQSETRGFGGVAVGWTAGWRRDRTPVCGTCTDVHLQKFKIRKNTEHADYGGFAFNYKTGNISMRCDLVNFKNSTQIRFAAAVEFRSALLLAFLHFKAGKLPLNGGNWVSPSKLSLTPSL